MIDPFQRPCPHCNGTGLLPLRFDPGLLLQTISDFVGERDFSTGELKHHADVVGGPLRVAIGSMSSNQLGKALRHIKNNNIDFNGLHLNAIGKEGNAIVWRIVDCR